MSRPGELQAIATAVKTVTEFSPMDHNYMAEALALAERGRGWVEPNPLVGAVLVKEGRVVGRGWHRRYGGAHAEIEALAEAGAEARGATLYVTLEPCCHHGKTPPCTQALLRAGVARVVAAMTDPFPQVRGQGIAELRQAGVGVEVGLCQEQAARLNAPYLKLVGTGRPYVIVKWAMSLDGRIATWQRDSRWVSGEAARQMVHELRGRVDGILVGIGTVLADDPLLTARPPGPRRAARIVLDSRLRLPRDSNLVRTAHEAPVLVFHGPEADAASRQRLEEAGCQCLLVQAATLPQQVLAVLDELGRRRMTNLLVEGGAEVIASFLASGETDELMVFLAPRIIGGRAALGPVGGPGVSRLAQAMPIPSWTVQQVGEDLLIRAWLRQPAASPPVHEPPAPL